MKKQSQDKAHWFWGLIARLVLVSSVWLVIAICGLQCSAIVGMKVAILGPIFSAFVLMAFLVCAYVWALYRESVCWPTISKARRLFIGVCIAVLLALLSYGFMGWGGLVIYGRYDSGRWPFAPERTYQDNVLPNGDIIRSECVTPSRSMTDYVIMTVSFKTQHGDSFEEVYHVRGGVGMPSLSTFIIGRFILIAPDDGRLYVRARPGHWVCHNLNHSLSQYAKKSRENYARLWGASLPEEFASHVGHVDAAARQIHVTYFIGYTSSYMQKHKVSSADIPAPKDIILQLSEDGEDLQYIGLDTANDPTK